MYCKDFVVHITVIEAEPGADLSIEIGEGGEGGVLDAEVEHMGTLTIGGKANETISITTEISDSLPDLQGFMTLQTVKGATASCD